MSKQWKWQRRDKRQQSDRKRMPKSGRSVFTIVEEQVKRAEKLRKEGSK
jgi:hypothetical protein